MVDAEPTTSGAPADPPTVTWHRRVFRNTLINGAGMLFAVVVAFFMTPFLVRHLGASAYGLWGLLGAFSVSAGYLSLADLGVQQTVVKLVAEHEARGEWEEVGRVSKATIYLFLVIGAAGGTACALFALFGIESVFHIPPDLRHAVRIAFLLFAAQIPIELSTLPYDGILEGRQRYGLIQITELAPVLVWIGIVVVALMHGEGLVAMAAANLASALLGLVITGVAAHRSLPPHTVRYARPTRATFRRIFSFSINLFVARVTGVLYRQMDRVIIAAFLTSILLARYEIASKIQILGALALAFTASAIMPAASMLSSTLEGKSKLSVMFLEGTKYTLVIVLPIAVAFMIWADVLIRAWVGPSFDSSIGYSRWFMVWVLFTATNTVGLTMIVGMGYARQVMVFGLVSAVVNLAVSIALVPSLGVLGVIAGTLVGYGIVWYPYMRLFLRALELKWLDFWARTVGPVVVVAGPWTLVVLLFHDQVAPRTLLGALLAVAISICIAWAAMFMLSLRSEERRVLLSHARSIFSAT